MSTYLMKFEKSGSLRYISHLDLMRLFQRVFKRGEVGMVYSKGFNPHPKMSIAQPLSLGFTGKGEYLEFETVETFSPEELCDRFNALFPDGLSAIACEMISDDRKNAASLVGMGSYEIRWRTAPVDDMEAALNAFCRQKEIFAEKAQKKTKALKEIDIRPMIKSAQSIGRIGDRECLRVYLATGSQANLNPELFMKAFAVFLQREFSKEDLRICREALYCEDGSPLM